LQALSAIGSAKVSKLFDLATFKKKTFFKLFFSRFAVGPPPVEAGCKGTISFSDSASG
jgi:hypothetical protein